MTMTRPMSLLCALALVLASHGEAGAAGLPAGPARGPSALGVATGAPRAALVAQQGPAQPPGQGADRSPPGASHGAKAGAGGHGGVDHAPTMSPRSALKPAEGASVKILSPRPQQVVAGDGILLKYSLVRGKRGHHVHAYVDGKLVGMFKKDPGASRAEGTLPRLEPGQRTLELRVVADDHETELDATATVVFTVK